MTTSSRHACPRDPSRGSHELCKPNRQLSSSSVMDATHRDGAPKDDVVLSQALKHGHHFCRIEAHMRKRQRTSRFQLLEQVAICARAACPDRASARPAAPS